MARLATADAAGAPHVVPFCYAVVGPHLYFVIDDKPKRRLGRALKRMRNIAENPAVAVLADDYAEDWRRLAFLLVRGRAEVVARDDERRRALTALRRRYPQYRSMPLAGAEHPVVRITPEHAHLWRAAGARAGHGAAPAGSPSAVSRPADAARSRRRAGGPGRPRASRPRAPRARRDRRGRSGRA